MCFKIGIIDSYDSLVQRFIVSTIYINSAAKHMIRVCSTTDSGIKLRTTITGRNDNRHVNAFTNRNKNVINQFDKVN